LIGWDCGGPLTTFKVLQVIFWHKLKALAVDLRAWNEEFSNIGGKKQVMWKELWVLEEITRKATVINDLEMSTLLEEVSLRRNRWRFG
jgi:hypothetical protein